MYSAAFSTVHYKEPLKLFELIVGPSLVWLRPSFCRDIAMIVQEAT